MARISSSTSVYCNLYLKSHPYFTAIANNAGRLVSMLYAALLQDLPHPRPVQADLTRDFA
jgi:hypothetical protein